MSPPPPVKYAATPDGSVAYQVFGEGRDRIVLVPDWHNPIEMLWEDPRAEQFFEHLGSFSRVIFFDKRGTGVSDPMPSDSELTVGPTIEHAAEDIGAVLDAEQWQDACIVGFGIGCWPAMLFAAAAPTRVSRLVLVDGLPRLHADDQYTTGVSDEDATRFINWIVDGHGTGGVLRLTYPAGYADPQFRDWYARVQRFAMPKKWMRAFWQSVAEVNITAVLSSISAPTLVMSRARSRIFPVAAGRYLAERIPGAEFRELPGGDELFFIANPSPVLAEMQQFMTGVREVVAVDRILATLLFTDIVGSTERLAAVGDRAWRDLVLRHHGLVRHELARFRGREIDTAGDGFLASFDGPARAVRCAVAVRDAVARLDLRLRIGVHIGECELADDKLAGIAVHIGSRVMQAASAGEILVSRTVKDLVGGSGIVLEPRGTHQLKGVGEPWELYGVAATKGER